MPRTMHPFRRTMLAMACVTGLAACGGGSDGPRYPTSGPSAFTEPGCRTNDTASFTLGVCPDRDAIGSTFVAGLDPQVSVVDFVNAQYRIDLPASLGGPQSFTLAEFSNQARLGDLRGRVLQKTFDSSVGNYTAVSDFATPVRAGLAPGTPSPVPSLQRVSFGTWERFYLDTGYYGAWFGPRAPGAGSLTTLPTSGSAIFNGVGVGVIGPGTLSTTFRTYGLSADVSLTIDYATSEVSGTLSGVFLSIAPPATAPLPPVTTATFTGRLDAPTRSIRGQVAGPGIVAGQFVGTLFGADAQAPDEVALRLRIETEGQRMLTAAGARTP